MKLMQSETNLELQVTGNGKKHEAEITDQVTEIFLSDSTSTNELAQKLEQEKHLSKKWKDEYDSLMNKFEILQNKYKQQKEKIATLELLNTKLQTMVFLNNDVEKKGKFIISLE